MYGLDFQARAYPERVSGLLARGIGLWDVIAEAEREGSLDAAIRHEVPNALGALVASLPALHTVAFNGGTAARIGSALLGGWAGVLRLVRLPSSSPAHAIAFTRKLEAWRALLPLEPAA